MRRPGHNVSHPAMFFPLRGVGWGFAASDPSYAIRPMGLLTGIA
ncbi:hypothetical protein R69919_01447 [Paraburkholderia gardini]|jgi:hypothetical protein|uniref:Uncharacterized protein n=1 Tax=Paraburkholderia gardini TaxID=2823469 RepID=A0ABM8TZL7_9BURK|nr:hypothetical protein R54767_00919 [Paraburkholderia gardini]CAG4892797.1 hypothetical protein R69919_01447 [Paraburkholderia gardini]